jgi:ADP-ribosylglycohydrolase
LECWNAGKVERWVLGQRNDGFKKKESTAQSNIDFVFTSETLFTDTCHLNQTRRKVMRANLEGMVWASFAGDSLALGVHWIYDIRVIDEKFGRVESFVKPAQPTYHPTKDRGEFTHYGDQTMVLLESVAHCQGFDLGHFAESWQALFKTYKGYFDGATRATLQNFAAGKGPREAGSSSTDLAGASRIAPLAYAYANELDQLIAAARAQTALTHNHPQVIDSAEFFARVVYQILQGATPTGALQEVVAGHFARSPYSRWVEHGLQSVDTKTRQAVQQLGQMCEAEAAFPAVIHLIGKYESDLARALVENVMAGGDSAGRGLIVGMVLGAYCGRTAIPAHWISELKAGDRIAECLARIPQEPRS